MDAQVGVGVAQNQASFGLATDVGGEVYRLLVHDIDRVPPTACGTLHVFYIQAGSARRVVAVPGRCALGWDQPR